MITALFSATKFCEMSPIELEGLEVTMRSRARRCDVMRLEASVLRSIDYRLNYDSEEEFLKIYALMLKLTDR